jgi:hypothetical protein
VAPKKSTLAYANGNRPRELYQTTFEQTLQKCQEAAFSNSQRENSFNTYQVEPPDGELVLLVTQSSV